jgi:putative hydrolase of the HAD superfamily
MYTNIFFDLDHTLWDFERNSRETLEELFFEFGLNDILNVPVNAFIELYEHENKLLWMDHLRGEISREFLRYERFRKTLGKFEVSDEPLIEGVADYYLEKSPRNNNLFNVSIQFL